MSNDLLARFSTDPNILIHQIDAAQDRAALVAFTAEEIRAAAFLDQRALTPQSQGALVAWQDVATLEVILPDAAPMMIFHIGHCGSTLISKLIEAAGGPRGLREPLPLRTFAMMEANLADGLSVWPRDDLESRLRLFLRTCAKNPKSAIKATSICNNLIMPCLAAGVQKVLFVTMPAQTYLTAMLGGENAALDIYGSVELRMRRLRQLCNDRIDDLADLSLGQAAALCWACENATVAQAISADESKRILTVDFDDFLKAPAPMLTTMVTHFGAAPNDAAIQTALAGPLMSQYSKAPEHQFTPDFRKQLLAQYASEQAAEIRKGMSWLERRAHQHPPIAAALAAFHN